MKDAFDRRSFLGRTALALGSALSMPLLSAARNIRASLQSPAMNPILSTRPLGFQWETADPFLFCVHHEDHFPAGNENMGPDPSHYSGRQMGDDFIIKDGFRMYHGKTVPGFPGHPHRGFETITVVRNGLVDHADSLGAAGRYGNGDVQWMTAGKGVQHSEMFPLLKQDADNPMELFQIWINLPASRKMAEPYFRMLWKEKIPIYTHTDSRGRSISVEVIAGQLADKRAGSPPPDSWAADPRNEVAVWNILMQPEAEWILPPASAGINRMLYYYEGSGLRIAETEAGSYHAIQLKPEVPVKLQAGKNGASLLMLQGRPIGEPVIQYGPFVMNTKEEIHQAFQDYHATQFGGWPWPRYDQVHDRNKGRFARHADGTEE